MSQSSNQYMKILGVVTQMMIMMGLGFWGGYQLDNYVGNENNLYTLVVGLVVMFGALFIMVRRLNSIFEEEEK